MLAAHRSGRVQALVLDLTRYELGNALVRGRIGASPEQIAKVLSALGEICVEVMPDLAELDRAAALAREHDLSFYDASYAAVAQSRDAVLVTADGALLGSGLGLSAAELAARLASADPGG